MENNNSKSGGMALASVVDKEYDSLPPECVEPGLFEPDNHFYPRVLNAQIHPMVSSFLSLGNERIIKRYNHLHPEIDGKTLRKYLTQYTPRFFRWAGADCFNVTDADGVRQMVVIETNSCPSGQKSMPYPSDDDESAGYKNLLASTFVPYLREREEKGDLPKNGVLAVIYDKNHMEASGYATELATLTNENVYLTTYYNTKVQPYVKFEDGVLSIKIKDEWTPVRAAFRYVTQKPWNRFPIDSKTLILNPVVACLAGGRNKMVASKAYDLFNTQLSNTGLEIKIPETLKDVSLAEIPMWVKSMGGHAVIKVPYSNAGQGVYTITSKEELDDFMAIPHKYAKFVIQSLIGNSSWTSKTTKGTYFHVGTIPNKRNSIYVADIRMMIGHAPGKGYKPIAVYGRRAARPLEEKLTPELAADSWSMLGTNLSGKDSGGSWTTNTSRLLLMDRRDFNKLGIGIDDLIDAYVQTMLSAVAIDKMCQKFIDAEGNFDFEMFSAINVDRVLLDEVLEGCKLGATKIEPSKK